MDCLVLLVMVIWTQLCLVRLGAGASWEKFIYLLLPFLCTCEIDQRCNFELFGISLEISVKIYSFKK